jgi:hypothetical protein
MAILGALVGVAALARPEGLLLLPLLAIPLLRRTEGARLRYGGILLAGCALVVTPWVARNWHEFGRPLFSTNEGITLAGANCDATYYGDHLGGFTTTCVEALGVPPDENKAQRAERLREEGLRYMADHAGRAIVVAGARFGRLWGVYRPSAQQGLPGRNADLQRVGIVVYYIVLVAGIAGAVLLHQRRRYRVLWILLAPVLVASLTAVATYGLVRLRHIAEISLLVLAGVALARLRPARALREN